MSDIDKQLYDQVSRMIIEYYILGGWYKHRKEQQKLAYMCFHTRHDVGILPGGYFIHYSFCDECVSNKENK